MSVFFLVFLGLYLRHMKIPRLRVESELLLWAYATATAMPDPSYICELHYAHGNPGSLTCRAGPGIEPASSWIPAGFVTSELQQELHVFFFFNMVKYTYHEIYLFNHFWVYNSVVLDTFTLLCNHHHYPSP